MRAHALHSWLFFGCALLAGVAGCGGDATGPEGGGNLSGQAALSDPLWYHVRVQ